MDTCCQYFENLSEADRDTINGHDTVLVVMSLIMSFFGATLFSIWAIFLQMKGRFGSYATVTLSSALISQFSLLRTVVAYGEYCIECSNLEMLLVPPRLYPFYGLVIFIGGSILLGTYFQVDFDEQKWFFI